MAWLRVTLRRAHPLAVQLAALAEPDDKYPLGFLGPQQRELAKPRLDVLGPREVGKRRRQLLVFEEADANQAGIDLARIPVDDLNLHGGGQYRFAPGIRSLATVTGRSRRAPPGVGARSPDRGGEPRGRVTM